jgi:hypothetical protein
MPPLDIASVLSRFFLDLDQTYAICARQTYDICTRKPTLNLADYVNADNLQLLHDNNSHQSKDYQEKLAFVLIVLNPDNQLHIGEGHDIQKLIGDCQENKIDPNE